MCRSCGAIVGAGESQCAVCGAATTDQATSQRSRPADRETMRFARAILERPYKFTIILLAANIFVFMLMWQSSGMKLSALGVFPSEVLIAYGAKLNEHIKNQHEWWRLVTPMFVHINLLHLMVNMYSLWILGPFVEKLYGSSKFVLFWVVSGVGALVASYLAVVDPGTPLGPLGRFLFRLDGPAAGASGALFGLVGILFVFGIKYRHELPEGFKRAFGTGLLPTILLNLFIGYIGRGLFDNAAHLGGLITGAGLALVVGYRRPGEKTRAAVTWRVLQIAAVALVVISFVKVAQHLTKHLPVPVIAPLPQTSAQGADFVLYSRAINGAQDSFYDVIQGDAGNVDTAVKSLDSAPHLDQNAAELKVELKTLLLEAKKLRITRGPAPEARKNEQREKELTASFEAWRNEYEHWLKTTGRTHGGLTPAGK